MDSLFHFFSSLLFFSGDLSFKQVFIPILIGSMVPDTLHVCTYIWIYIKKGEPFSVKHETLWYYGKIFHSLFLVPIVFLIPAYYFHSIRLMTKAFVFHILLDIFTHKQDNNFYLFPMKRSLPQLGIFDWSRIQKNTNKFMIHPLTYGLWAGVILGLFLKTIRVF
jgi:hypothetical protein